MSGKQREEAWGEVKISSQAWNYRSHRRGGAPVRWLRDVSKRVGNNLYML